MFYRLPVWKKIVVMLGGHVDVWIGTLGGALPHVQANTVRVLGVSAAQRQPGPSPAQGSLNRRFGRLISHAQWSLWWEEAWPRIWLPLTIILLFLTLSWFGLWLDTSPFWRSMGLALFAAAWGTITMAHGLATGWISLAGYLAVALVLIAVPLFVFMGYLVERAALIDRLFRALHLATARVPGSLAVATIAIGRWPAF